MATLTPTPVRLASSPRRRRTRRGPRPLRVGVIGYGYWGPNLVRNFAEIEGAEVAAVSDTSAERLRLVKARYSNVAITTARQDLFAEPEIDAIVVATPVATHFRLGMEALQAGKHLLMSKPLTDN